MTDRQAKEKTLTTFSGRFVGIVQWCMMPPAGIGFQTHKFSFIDAIHTAISFIEARMNRPMAEYSMYAGRMVCSLVSILPQFQVNIARLSATQERIGVLCGVSVYLDPGLVDTQAKIGEFRLGAPVTMIQITQASP